MDFIEYLDLSKNPRDYLKEFEDLISTLSVTCPDIKKELT
jgi:hypothetical protein